MYKHPIAFERMDENEGWQAYFTCHAKVNGLSGKEYWEAAAVQAQDTVKFTVRYCKELAALTPQDCRILFRGRTYNVQSIDNYMFENRALTFRAVANYGRS